MNPTLQLIAHFTCLGAGLVLIILFWKFVSRPGKPKPRITTTDKEVERLLALDEWEEKIS